MLCVFDFDNTVYRGDSSVDFVRFCMSRYPRLRRHIFPIFICGVKMTLFGADRTREKEKIFSLFKEIEDIDTLVSDFWNSHYINIKSFYIERDRSHDLIVSAGPVFLLEPAALRLGVPLIATEVDKLSGRFLTPNCHGSQKVLRLAQYTEEIPDEFYSDSKSDLPLKLIAKKAFMVKGDTITLWK